MSHVKDLGRTALIKATEIRKQLKVKSEDSFNVIDAAIKLSLEVRFVDLPTIEGLYYPDNLAPKILLGNQRPLGRQNFNCAHELGHFVFKHDDKIDIHNFDQTKNDEERIADFFASHLLMPQLVTLSAFKKRGLIMSKIKPIEIFKVANYLEVGYITLLNQLYFTFRSITKTQYDFLSKITPKKIRNEIIDTDENIELVFVDEFWTTKPIDIRTGDIVHAPLHIYGEGSGLKAIKKESNYIIYQAIKQTSSSKLTNNKDWAQFVRISEKNYAGLAEYRHLEKEDI